MESSASLKKSIEEVLNDEHCSGAPPTLTAEQLTMIFAIACEAVEDSGRPVARWTQKEIIEEAIKRGIIESMSTSHLSALLAEAHLQPHKSRYWLNTREKDPEVFLQQTHVICEAYLQATDLAEHHNTRTVCVDEMTSIQALERKAPKKRRSPVAANRSNLNRHDTAHSV